MEQAVEQPPPRRYTVSEYFELEAASDQKHEYRDGQIIAMAGGTESHSLIIANVIGELRSRLKDQPCRVYDSNLRVKVDRRYSYAYPDILVVCGERKFDPDDPSHITITNPKLVVEVLSPSTELSDRGEKFSYYLQSPTLEEYVMISQDKAKVETFLRQPDGTWSFAYFIGREATARLRCLQIELPLTEVYAKVDLPKVIEEDPS